MKIWKFVKKDLGYYKKVAGTEVRFHKTVWHKLAPNGFRIKQEEEKRQPWGEMDADLREKRLQQEKMVLFSMIALLCFLTGYLIVSQNWEGFAVWLMFATLVIRSLIIIRKLKGEK